jgi:pimeloyl-ACP methyl ester carboxylesterase
MWAGVDEMVESYCCRGGFSTWESRDWIKDYLLGGTVAVDGGVRLSCEPAWEAATFASTPHNVWNELRRVKCPLTVVYGAESDTFLPAAARLLPAILPQAKLLPVPGTGHFVPMEQPAALRQKIVSMADSQQEEQCATRS